MRGLDYLERKISDLRVMQSCMRDDHLDLQHRVARLEKCIFWLVFVDIIFAILIYPWVA